MRSPEPTDPSGRGLKIIDMLSARWGVEPEPAEGKTVWFTISDSRQRWLARPARRSQACPARSAIPRGHPASNLAL